MFDELAITFVYAEEILQTPRTTHCAKPNVLPSISLAAKGSAGEGPMTPFPIELFDESEVAGKMMLIFFFIWAKKRTT